MDFEKEILEIEKKIQEIEAFAKEKGLTPVIVSYAKEGQVLSTEEEKEYLRDIQKTAETRIGKPRLHTLALGINSFVIVLLFYFDKSQRQTIDKDGYVRAKVVARQITASHFGGYLKRVVTNEVRGRR